MVEFDAIKPRWNAAVIDRIMRHSGSHESKSRRVYCLPQDLHGAVHDCDKYLMIMTVQRDASSCGQVVIPHVQMGKKA